MSILRRRNQEKAPSIIPTSSKTEDGEEVCLVPVSELKAVSTKGRKRRIGFIFALGGIFGIMLAAFFAQKNDVIHLAALSDLTDRNLESLANVLPHGIIKDAKHLSVSCGACFDLKFVRGG